MMNRDRLFKQLEAKKTLIQGKWLQLILDTYPKETARFLERETDNFLNPVGSITSQEISTIYDELIGGMNSEKLSSALERIIRIRAIQEFSPSKALNFIPLLKKVVRETLINDSAGQFDWHELNDFENRLEKIIFLAFDIYMECRERVFNIKINELAKQSENMRRILVRANQEYE